MSAVDKGLLHDEQGNRSLARTLLAIDFALVWAYLYGAAWEWWALDPVAVGVMSAMFLALVAWAGGARVAQYVAPQIGATVTALSRRLKGVDDSRRDDERG